MTAGGTHQGHRAGETVTGAELDAFRAAWADPEGVYETDDEKIAAAIQAVRAARPDSPVDIGHPATGTGRDYRPATGVHLLLHHARNILHSPRASRAELRDQVSSLVDALTALAARGGAAPAWYAHPRMRPAAADARADR